MNLLQVMYMWHALGIFLCPLNMVPLKLDAASVLPYVQYPSPDL